MAEVEWIKIRVDTFEDEKIRLIEALPEGDTLLVIWLKMLAHAGKINDRGYIYLKEGTPYTPQMLSIVYNRPQPVIDLALKTFQDFGMIEIDERGIRIVNWEKHQNIDGLERIRKQTRERVRKYREKQKQEQLLLEAGTKPSELQCAYCGDSSETVDHIIPRVKGGADTPDNIVPCCKSCNSSKHDKDLADFLNDSISSELGKVKLNLVLNHQQLMSYVDYQNGLFVQKRYSNATVTDGNAVDKEKEEEKEKEKNSRRQKTFGDDSPYMKMAVYLKERILSWKPNAKIPKDLNSWADEFRKIHEIDNRSKQDIKDVIDWATSNSFWQTNILSPKKLRKQFDTLQGQMNNERMKWNQMKKERERQQHAARPEISKHSGSAGSHSRNTSLDARIKEQQERRLKELEAKYGV